MKPRRWLKRILLSFSLLLLVGLGVSGYFVHSYVKTSPEFCTSCHNVQPASHRGVICQTCHQTELTTSLKQLWLSVIGEPKRSEKHAAVDERVCGSCHAKDTRWPRVEATAGHQVHVKKAGIPCVRCHGAGEHTQKPSATVCQDCHRAVTVTIEKMGKLHCTSCHDFMAKGERLAPGRSGCLNCHQKDQRVDFVKGTHNQLSCAQCHAPHASRKPGESSVLRVDCTKCHERPVRETAAALASARSKNKGPATPVFAAPKPSGKPAIVGKATRVRPLTFGGSHGTCRTCHAPHAARGQASQGCVGCHGDKLPKLHTRGHKECVTCHKPHEWKPAAEVRNCSSCHGAVTAAKATMIPKHRDCGGCHSPHLQAPARTKCVGCHAPVVAAVAKEAKVHGECAACHPKHGAPKQGAQACLACHGQKLHASSGAHEQCTQCHTPHALGGLQKARLMCATCHARQGKPVRTAATTPHDRCGTCHAPHEDPRGGPKPCADCHEAQKLSGTHQACTKCHAPHGVRKADARGCVSCHAQVAKKGAPAAHQQCASCHPTHTPNPAAKSFGACVSCHPVETRRAHAKGGKHAECKNCHAPHEPAAKGNATCTKCHAEPARKVASVTHPAAHGKCASCHPTHALKPSGVTACKSCHVNVSTAAAAFVDSRPAAKPHRDCLGCHAKHGSPAPQKACATCHASVRKGSNLHAVGAHARCGDCHATHDPRVSGRDRCLSCHTQQRGHMPGVSECKGCHQFR